MARPRHRRGAKFPHRLAPARRKKIFTDGEIVDGFFKTAFGAEYHLAGRVDRIRKYDAPVRVFADGNRADRKAQLAKVVADIAPRSASRHRHGREAARRQCAGQAGARPRSQSHHLDLLRQRAGARDQNLARSAMPVRLPQERKFEIEHSDVILTVDNGDFVFLDCAYEELLQSLGPINDTAACPGPCSTTTCRWAISTSTTSTS
jgi:hypothetical protein